MFIFFASFFDSFYSWKAVGDETVYGFCDCWPTKNVRQLILLSVASKPISSKLIGDKTRIYFNIDGLLLSNISFAVVVGIILIVVVLDDIQTCVDKKGVTMNFNFAFSRWQKAASKLKDVFIISLFRFREKLFISENVHEFYFLSHWFFFSFCCTNRRC